MFNLKKKNVVPSVLAGEDVNTEKDTDLDPIGACAKFIALGILQKDEPVLLDLLTCLFGAIDNLPDDLYQKLNTLVALEMVKEFKPS